MAQRRKRAEHHIFAALVVGFTGLTPAAAQDVPAPVQVSKMAFDTLVPQTQDPASADLILVLLGASPLLSAASLMSGTSLLPLVTK